MWGELCRTKGEVDECKGLQNVSVTLNLCKQRDLQLPNIVGCMAIRHSSKKLQYYFGYSWHARITRDLLEIALMKLALKQEEGARLSTA